MDDDLAGAGRHAGVDSLGDVRVCQFEVSGTHDAVGGPLPDPLRHGIEQRVRLLPAAAVVDEQDGSGHSAVAARRRA